MTTNILPFGTSTDSATNDLAQIKLFGCTVIDFNVSADWSSQGGSLSCKIIEDEYYRNPVTNNIEPDRLIIPVLGSPALFELKTTSGEVVFQYIGIVDSFSRNSNQSKTYSVNIASPLAILEATQVILDGYIGLGTTIEGSPILNGSTGLTGQDFGHNNSLINVLDKTPGIYHWWNVSNLINVFGILENEDIAYRCPTSWNAFGSPQSYGGFGYSGKSEDGMPLIKLMWALHFGINHLLPVTNVSRQRTLAGNLLFGRGNYDISLTSTDLEAYPYYYHFDAIGLYNQLVNKLGPQYRVAGQSKTLREIISHICGEANVEFYSYIDLYDDVTIGEPTLQEYDPYWSSSAIMNWSAGNASKLLDTRKFSQGGRYGGTIRIKTIDKNAFLNPYRPMSNIAYNLIGLEVPDLKGTIWNTTSSGIHPGLRPVTNYDYGIDGDLVPYSDPLDSKGIGEFYDSMEWKGFTRVGTKSVAHGGTFPVQSGDYSGSNGTGIFDPDKLGLAKIKNSDISIKLNDVVTMKVVTGGYQSRIVSVAGKMLRHYWGDIIVEGSDPRETNDTATDSLGLNEISTRKIPVITPILDPRDVDDYILIDMKSIFGNYTCAGVLQNGIYAASMLEIRCAMKSEESWKAFFTKYKFQKLKNLMNCFYPSCTSPQAPGGGGLDKQDLEESTESTNSAQGLGYVGVSDYLGLGNTFALAGGDTKVDAMNTNYDESGVSKDPADTGVSAFGLGINLACAAAEANIKKDLLPAIHEKIKEIGDAHYGKSWYAPVPYCQTIEDLDGNNLVGNFKRSWELSDNAYVEPAYYYAREVPQSNMFITDGKVSAFVNYDNNFIAENGPYDKSYAQDVTSLVGQTRQIFNFSEYTMDKLCVTKYGTIDVIHAEPENIENRYQFLPMAYDRFYNRAILPFSDIVTGQTKKWINTKNASSGEVVGETEGSGGQPTGGTYVTGLVPTGAGQSDTQYFTVEEQESPESNASPTEAADCPGDAEGQVSDLEGYFQYGFKHGIPAATHASWLQNIVPALSILDYKDNGRFSFPFVKFTTSRVFLPVPAPNSPVARFPSTWGFNKFVDGNLKRTTEGQECPSGDAKPGGSHRQFLITEDHVVSILNPFPACVAPRSFNYPQISTRYVYGPWMTNLNTVVFRGKIEYEQDDSLVPENFLIPLNFGPFGTYNLSQTSGFAGMNLAAQGRANAIENFGLFALEEGSITVPGAPAIKRIGDSLYGIPQVTDVKINVTNDNIETTYSFKTIAPKFGKNTRDLEKKLTKISNEIKKLKLR
jgi:hypothetical protein